MLLCDRSTDICVPSRAQGTRIQRDQAIIAQIKRNQVWIVMREVRWEHLQSVVANDRGLELAERLKGAAVGAD